MIMKVSDLLKKKGSGVYTIEAHSTMSQVLKNMIDNKVGALVIIDSKHSPIGIITERDILRIVNKMNMGEWEKTSVGELMTKDIIIGMPDDDVEYIMALMTENRFRHVPIITDGKLAGLISIGDIVKSMLTDIKAENRHLSDYITGKYPA
jgi:CBS domain-containing protein